MPSTSNHDAEASTKARRPTRGKAAGPQAGKDECFIMSPFGGWFDAYYDKVFKPAVEDAGLQPRRADDLYRPSAIVNDIWMFIRQSSVMLADLTDRNPNVFYELGLAHALGKPVVLTTQDITDVPFDLRSLRVLEYAIADPEWSQTLKAQIVAALGEVLEKPEDAVLAPFLHREARHQPSVEPDEARFRQIEQELARLRALVRTPAHEKAGRMTAAEARDQLQRLWAEGMHPAFIYQTLTSQGAPSDWVLRRLAKSLDVSGDINSIDELVERYGDA